MKKHQETRHEGKLGEPLRALIDRIGLIGTPSIDGETDAMDHVGTGAD